MLNRAKRVASVRCVTYCNLYSLDCGQFELVLESYPLMRRTMESVAAERLNKLGKNPSIISTRHDLKRDAAFLKDMIDRTTPQLSSSQTEKHNLSSLIYLSNQFSKSNDQLETLNKRKRRKSSTEEQKLYKLSRLFLGAPSSATTTLNVT